MLVSDVTNLISTMEDEMCEKLIQLSFAKIVNSKTERGGARLHKNLLVLHLLQKARLEQRNRLLASSPMDISSHVIDYKQSSNKDVESADVVDAERDESAQEIQTDCVIEDDDEENVDNSERENVAQSEMKIDETSCQQITAWPSATASWDSADVTSNVEPGSAYCYDGHLTSSCLSYSFSDASSNSNFDNNSSGTPFIQRWSEYQQTTPFQQLSNINDAVRNLETNPFYVNRICDFEEEITHDYSTQESPSSDVVKEMNKDLNDDEFQVRHPVNEQRMRKRLRRRSYSAQEPRDYSRKTSSSSSSASDESSDETCWRSGPSNSGNFSEMENMEENKSRDCLKRKFDDTQTASSGVSPFCEWRSPKVACLVHGEQDLMMSPSFQCQQPPNLNGLISVLQSAALDESTTSSGRRDDDKQLALTAHIFDTERVDSSSTLTRSMSCPGLMELACES